MKYIRETSDIHLDFDICRWNQTRLYDPGAPKMSCDMDLLWYPEKMEGDEDTCMIIAGDLWVARKMLKRKHPYTKRSWMSMMSDQFKYVVFVLGNHDLWSQNVHVETGRVNDELVKQGLDHKVFLLEKTAIVLDQVKFVGGTLWTDYDRQNPLVMLNAKNIMNDYRRIRATSSYRKVTAQNLLQIHISTRDFIFDNAVRDTPDQKVVVVTHMAPSYKSIHPMYRFGGSKGRSVNNFFYYSDMDAEIDVASENIDLWFHGHCHCVSDYNISKTRVICNPRGYHCHEDTSWNPRLRIDL